MYRVSKRQNMSRTPLSATTTERIVMNYFFVRPFKKKFGKQVGYVLHATFIRIEVF